jgi:two-component system, NarL family, nitrate/nitrite response regulator NarL
MRILIADDNPRVRGAIRDLLSSGENWDICGETWNGPETLKQARELRPDLLILHVHMPFPNGFETARLIRQEIPEIKILIISQYDAADLLPSALEAGADACLDKARLGSDRTLAVKDLQDLSRQSAASE